MIMRLPFKGVHMIVYGINIFNMVTGHIFTFLVGMNIIVNLLFDPTFFKDSVTEGTLKQIIIRLFAQTGFFTSILMGISIVWGSTYSTIMDQDPLSIAIISFCLIITCIYYVYFKLKKIHD